MFLRPSAIIEEIRQKKYILPGMKGADFGCGGGYFTALLAHEVGSEGKIYAIDVQEEILKETQEFLKNLNIFNVAFLHQDLEVDTGLEDESVDFVFISQVLYQSQEPEKIIFQAYKILKINGFLIIIEANQNSFLFSQHQVHSKEKIINIVENQKFNVLEIIIIGDFYVLTCQKQ